MQPVTLAWGSGSPTYTADPRFKSWTANMSQGIDFIQARLMYDLERAVRWAMHNGLKHGKKPGDFILIPDPKLKPPYKFRAIPAERPRG